MLKLFKVLSLCLLCIVLNLSSTNYNFWKKLKKVTRSLALASPASQGDLAEDSFVSIITQDINLIETNNNESNFEEIIDYNYQFNRELILKIIEEAISSTKGKEDALSKGLFKEKRQGYLSNKSIDLIVRDKILKALNNQD